AELVLPRPNSHRLLHRALLVLIIGVSSSPLAIVRCSASLHSGLCLLAPPAREATTLPLCAASRSCRAASLRRQPEPPCLFSPSRLLSCTAAALSQGRRHLLTSSRRQFISSELPHHRCEF